MKVDRRTQPAQGVRFAASTRKVLRQAHQLAPGTEDVPVALVVPNGVLRVVLSFIMQIAQHRNSALFSNEKDALEWLDRN